MSSFTVRPGRPADLPAFIALMKGLAASEDLPGPDAAAQARLHQHAFASPRPFELLVAEEGGEVRGCAVYFFTYSTFLACPVLDLEDLFVDQAARGRGMGSALMKGLAEIAVERGCGRLQWHVREWNEKAQAFYQRLGAAVLRDFWLCRVEGAAISALARAA
jgi:GNAT superfamily N-acetyltransferase